MRPSRGRRCTIFGFPNLARLPRCSLEDVALHAVAFDRMPDRQELVGIAAPHHRAEQERPLAVETVPSQWDLSQGSYIGSENRMGI